MDMFGPYLEEEDIYLTYHHQIPQREHKQKGKLLIALCRFVYIIYFSAKKHCKFVFIECRDILYRYLFDLMLCIYIIVIRYDMI